MNFADVNFHEYARNTADSNPICISNWPYTYSFLGACAESVGHYVNPEGIYLSHRMNDRLTTKEVLNSFDDIDVDDALAEQVERLDARKCDFERIREYVLREASSKDPLVRAAQLEDQFVARLCSIIKMHISENPSTVARRFGISLKEANRLLGCADCGPKKLSTIFRVATALELRIWLEDG